MEKSLPKFQLSYSQLDSKLFSYSAPHKFSQGKLVIFNHDLATDLGLLEKPYDELFYEHVFSGQKTLSPHTPIALAYAGHQFGYFTMLGDGRAHLLTEIITPKNHCDLQLKGSGSTPYSRRGDGKAVLGPMLREYLISEAMHALSIPTTRSLAVLTTGERVYRERALSGAVLARIASSHIRVGTFQYVNALNDPLLLKNLADYTIKRHFPEILTQNTNPYLALLESVIARQAILIAHWQSVGFVHGVMNTDNMAISGETIDYGPCAFMDTYDPRTVFSSIDQNGRYAYGNQPSIALWNLQQFANALLPLIHEDTTLSVQHVNSILNTFNGLYNTTYLSKMLQKIGISEIRPGDALLISDLLDMLYDTKSDYTQFFIDLTYDNLDNNTVKHHGNFTHWIQTLKSRQDETSGGTHQSISLMKEINPVIIPRNHLVEQALLAAQNKDMGPFHQLLNHLKNPYRFSEELVKYAKAPEKSNGQYKTYCGT